MSNTQTKQRRRRLSDLLAEELRDDVAVVVHSGFRSGQSLAIPTSLMDRHAQGLVRASLIEDIARCADAGELAQLSLTFVHDPRWMTSVDAARVDLAEVRKASSMIKKRAPDAIVQLNSAIVPSSDAGYRVQLVLAVLGIKGAQDPRPWSTSARGSMFSNPWVEERHVENPNRAEATETVTSFLRSQVDFRRAVNAQATESEDDQWAATRVRRSLLLEQLGSLFPVKKALFPIGAAREFYDRAIVQLKAYDAAIAKRADSVGRDELIHAWWREYLADPENRYRPPLVAL